MKLFQESLAGNNMEQTCLKPKYPKSVRSLSDDAACHKKKKILPVVVNHLRKEALEKNDPMVIAPVKLCQSWEFVATFNLMSNFLL